MPPWLGPKEQEVWSRLVPNLQSLRRADGELLARLCQASSAATRAWAQLGGAVTATTADGNPKTHPAWGVWRDSVNLVYRLSAVFGLSPADRERLFGSLPDDDPDDDILDWNERNKPMDERTEAPITEALNNLFEIIGKQTETIAALNRRLDNWEGVVRAQNLQIMLLAKLAGLPTEAPKRELNWRKAEEKVNKWWRRSQNFVTVER
jgi:P27 family predicted phage terminase small subunit